MFVETEQMNGSSIKANVRRFQSHRFNMSETISQTLRTAENQQTKLPKPNFNLKRNGSILESPGR